MESRRKRKRSQITKWVCYALLMLLCTVLQTLPGLFRLGEAKPLWLLPLALAVAVEEGEFAGGIFGAVCGLMWDYTAGRTAGLLAFELLLLCFLLSAVMAAFSAFLMFAALEDSGLSMGFIVGIVGMAGYSGGTALDAMQTRLLRKIERGGVEDKQ